MPIHVPNNQQSLVTADWFPSHHHLNDGPVSDTDQLSGKCQPQSPMSGFLQASSSESFDSNDSILSSNICDSDLELNDTFVENVQTGYTTLKLTQGLKCCHLNVHSLLPKMDELQHLIIDLNVDCMSVCETWLDSSILDNEISISDYILFRNDRNRNGGGVVLYIHKDYKPTALDIDTQTESLYVNIKCKSNKFIIGSIYRPPSALAAYHEQILSELEHVHSFAVDIILMGDFNYDDFKPTDHEKICEIEDLFQVNQQIKSATRVTCDSETLIDHIYISNNIEPVVSGVLTLSLSDHYAVFSILTTKKDIVSSKLIRKRNYNKFKLEDFLNDIVSSNTFQHFIYIDDVNQAWDHFKHEFLSICDKHAPIRNFRVKTASNPWITKDILMLIYKRDFLHKRAIRNHDHQTLQRYRTLRNKVTSTIRKAKFNYYSHQINKLSNDSKSMWRTLKQVLPSKKNYSSNSDINPEIFNDYFSTIGKHLTEDFGDLVLPQLDISVQTNFSFHEINSNFILKELLKLSLVPKMDFLGFDSKLLHLSSLLIAPLLCHIFNLSLFSGNVPQDFKTARVTPIYKGQGSQLEAGNYRPISVVPTVTKIIEKFVKIELISHLSSNNLIASHQYAYLKNHSTQTALHHLIDTCLSNINEGYCNIISMLDLSKGFDVLNRDILFHKLSKYGVLDSALL